MRAGAKCRRTPATSPGAWRIPPPWHARWIPPPANGGTPGRPIAAGARRRVVLRAQAVQDAALVVRAMTIHDDDGPVPHPPKERVEGGAHDEGKDLLRDVRALHRVGRKVHAFDVRTGREAQRRQRFRASVRAPCRRTAAENTGFAGRERCAGRRHARAGRRIPWRGGVRATRSAPGGEWPGPYANGPPRPRRGKETPGSSRRRRWAGVPLSWAERTRQAGFAPAALHAAAYMLRW